MPCRWWIRWPSIWHSSLYQTFWRETIGKMHLSCGVCFVVLHHCQLTNAVAVHLFVSVILKLCFIFLLPVKGNKNCMQWPLIHCRLQGIIFTYANPAYLRVSQVQTESPSFLQVVVLVPDLLDVKDLTFLGKILDYLMCVWGWFRVGKVIIIIIIIISWSFFFGWHNLYIFHPKKLPSCTWIWSVIVRENQASQKIEVGCLTFIFSQYKNYLEWKDEQPWHLPT